MLEHFSRPSPARRLIAAVIALLMLAGPVWAELPVGGSITAGSGSIAGDGNTLTITQQSDRLAADWQSFSIGRENSVNFVQPSASAVALNRVLGSEVSTIQGALNANGQVYLLNPNGVLFTPTAQVNVGGLAASTLQMSDEDFLAGRELFAGDSTAAIVNQGTIAAADGGRIALIAARIVNEGTVEAQGGEVLLGAGRKVTLDLGGPVPIRVEEGALAALIEQGGAIRADGGTIYLTAGAADALAGSVINHTGLSQARTLATGEKGEILLLADMASGTVNVGGTLDASAPSGGDGGFVETSAANIKVADSAKITTAAPNGTTGTWLIDPIDFVIAPSGGDISGATLSSNMETTSSAYGVSGNVYVNDVVSWSSHGLLLSAGNNIYINSDLNVSGTGTLRLHYGVVAPALNNTCNYHLANGAKINLAADSTFKTKLGSDGTEITHTVITSLGDEDDATAAPATMTLQGMNTGLAGNYVLGADIDASATATWNDNGSGGYYGFQPIGNDVTYFTGNFDGLGHTITGLTINRSSNYVGLFGYIQGSLLSNVGMVDGDITGGSYVGTLVGRKATGSISRSYAVAKTTASVTGTDFVGGLVGYGSNISESYANVSVGGADAIGGLVGLGGNISNSYAAGAVSGDNNIGGLVGTNLGNISNSYAVGAVSGNSNIGGLIGVSNGTGSVTNSYWDKASTGRDNGYGFIFGGSFSGTGLATDDMKKLATFTAGSWSIDNAGGTGSTWRIYEGNTYPLLRGFLTPLDVQPAFDGSGAAMTAIGAGEGVGVHDADKVLGAADTLLLANFIIQDGYKANLLGSGIYSTQDGYDITLVPRTIATAGSLAGDIVLNNPVTWSSGTLALSAGAIHANAAINGSGSAIFDLWAGTWNQVNAALPAFAVHDFRLSGGTFLRALAGDGSAGSPYQLADIYGVQGMGSSGMLGNHYTLANDIDAGGTAGWNAGAGFVPVGNGSTYFTGNFDGLGHTITGLTINRSSNYVGLFGYTQGSLLSNVGLLDSSISGGTAVGALHGAGNATVNACYADGGSVTGTGSAVGGLVGNGNGSIGNSYTNVSVSTSGGNGTGGLRGISSGNISNSYALGSVHGNNHVGGLVGQLSGGISNAYAAGAISGNSNVGGLAGASISGTVTNSYWDKTVTPTDNGIGTGLASEDMMKLATFTAAGWDIDDAGGTGKVWRIYDGYTYPLLRNFLTPLTVQPAYDGSGTAMTDIGAYSIVGAHDPAKVLGTAADSLTLSSADANAYTATLCPGLYSTQQGYDLIASRTIVTPGSLAGDIALINPITWTSGTLAINAVGTTTQTATVSGSGSAVFDLKGGTWRQVDATLPAFAVNDFRISGGSFIRAFAGDGSGGSPYQLADIYGVQGMGSSGMLGLNYTLAGDVDAGGTVNWDAGAGFVPVGTGTLSADCANCFSGSFDGLGHTIGNLYINRPTSDYVGLFGQFSGAVHNLGLVGGSVSGSSCVGGLAGYHGYGTISNAYATGSVTGKDHVGGLAGTIIYGTISNAYATGKVTGTGTFGIGGLVGSNFLWGTIDNAYATGSVEGMNSVGGLIGANVGTVTNSYWDKTVTPTDNGIGTGLATADMQQLATFADAGWDIDDAGGTGKTWCLYEGHTYPLLRDFLTPLTVTANDAGKTYDGLAWSGGNGVSLSDAGATLFGTASYGGNSQGATDAGSYDIAPGGLYSDQQGYDITFVDGTLTIAKADAVVTANSGTFTYNGQQQSVSGFTATGLVNGETESVLTGVTAGGSGKNAGTYVTVAGGTAGNYNLTFVDGVLTITPAPLTVTARDAVKAYNGTPYSGGNGVVYRGFVAGEDADALGGALTWGGSSQGAQDAGSYSITPGGLTAENYTLTFVDGTLTISPMPLVLVTADDQSKLYGDADPALTWTLTAGTLAAGDSLSGSLVRDPGENAGVYAIRQGTLTAGANYVLSFTDGVLTITPAPLTVAAADQSRVYGEAIPAFTYSASGFRFDDDLSLLHGELASDATAASAAGAYAIGRGTLAAGSNYTLTVLDGVLTIAPRPLVVAADDQQRRGGEANPPLTYSVGGMGLVNGDSANEVFAGALTTEATAASAPGAYAIEQGTLTASDGNYQLAGFVPGTLTVGSSPAVLQAALHYFYRLPEIVPDTDDEKPAPSSGNGNLVVVGGGIRLP